MDTGIGPSGRKRGLCLLSLDGGGIRGLSELIIIEELMERLKWVENLSEVPIPADRFDLIGGTSTGGLIAILLGRLRLSAADAVKAYEALAGKVFSEKKSKGKDGTFKASSLEEAIKGVVKNTLGSEQINARMYEAGEAGSDQCRAFVCAVGTTDVTHAAGPTLFRSYDVAKNKEYNCTIWEAARATSAAPTFFKRIKIGPIGSGVDYVDAGIGCNNPVKEVIAEAARVFGDDATIAGIVSIGTGQSGSVGLAKPDAFQKWLPTNLINVLKEIATDSGRVAEEMERKYKQVPGLYNRLDVDRRLQSVSLDEWKRLGDVRAYTKNYMRLEAINKRLDNVVGVLNGTFAHQACTAVELVGSVRPRFDKFLRINVSQPRIFHFVARPTVLAAISDRFGDSTSARIVILLGMGGSGKTQLALEFCRQAEEILGFMAVVWINASSPVSVMQGYRAVAKKILKGHQGDLTSEDAISLVQDTLRDWKHPWLFVFDNYDNPKAFGATGIHHYIPRGKEGRILFTSRHQDSARLDHKIEISSMTDNESLEVLLQHVPRNGEEVQHAEEISATLGYLALALDQAGSYIRAHKVRLCDFVTHYRKCKEQILKKIPDVWLYQTPISDEEKGNKLNIYTSWELSFKQISGSEEEIQQREHLLSLAAFLDCTRISERYFEAYFKREKPDWMAILSSEGEWDIYKLGGVLAEFHKLSLIQMQEHAMDQQLFSIHPVVRDWVQIRMKPRLRQEYVQESIDMLAYYVEGIDSDDQPLETNQETLLHIDNCFRHDKDLLSGPSFQGLDDAWSASWLGLFYFNQGRYEEAANLYERARNDFLEKLGSTHEYFLGMTTNLAGVYRIQDRFDEAKEILEPSLIDAKNALGATHPVTLLMMEDLANDYLVQSQYDEAEQLVKEVLLEKEKLGSTPPQTLMTVSSLARVYAFQGRYDEAEKLLERVLTGREEELGATHPATLLTVQNLGTLNHWQGRYDQSQKLYERALTCFKEKLGVKHPDTRLTARNLANLCRRQGRREEAEGLAEEFGLIWSDEKRRYVK